MKQQFLEVWKDGKVWYEFPAENEENVRLDLMRRNLDRVCDIRPKVEDIQVLKASVAKQVIEFDLTATTPKATAEELAAITAKPKRQRKPTAEKASHNHDIS